ncbi:porin [Rhodoferax sp. WC2427]|uniref:porin n=1 Tax=Rhodoferax sp. WC2427 TaxID=3234144 RepID=UPI0034674976
MKKSLIALAVLASTGAMAQSSVTLYGIVDVALQTSKVTNSPRQNTMESGGVNGSRFGLKGSEDLGGGLKALFVLENGFKADTGAIGGGAGLNGITNTKPATAMFGRKAYVGLAGGFGEFRLGNVPTAYDDTAINANSIFDSNYAPAYSVWAGGHNYNGTPGNSVYYASPSFGGVTLAASYALGENKTTTMNAKGLGAINVQYAGGPIYASLAYQEDKTSAPGVGTVATNAYKDTLANFSYDLGVVKLLTSYNRQVATDNTKSDQFQLGADVPVGAALTLSGGYAYSKDKLNGSTTEKRQGFGLGAKYALSKRTFVYTAATFAEQKPTGGTKVKGDVYAVGVQHSF